MSEHGLGLRIVTRLGERCIAVPLQVQDSDKTKLEVRSSVRTQLRITNRLQDWARGAQQCHCSCKTVTKRFGGALQCQSTV